MCGTQLGLIENFRQSDILIRRCLYSDCVNGCSVTKMSLFTSRMSLPNDRETLLCCTQFRQTLDVVVTLLRRFCLNNILIS